MPIEVPDTRAFADPPPRRRRAAATPAPPAPVQPAVATPAVADQPVRRKRAQAKPAQTTPAQTTPSQTETTPAQAETTPAQTTPAQITPAQAPGEATPQADSAAAQPAAALPAAAQPPAVASAFSRPVRRRPKPAAGTQAGAADQAAAAPVPEAVSWTEPAPAPVASPGAAALADAVATPDTADSPDAAAPRGPAGEERRGTEGAVEEVVQLTDTVVVRLNGTRYAVAMEAVAEVGRPPHVTRVPGVPTWIAGVANWRGRILPVLDLRVLLGAPTPELGMTGRVMVLARDGVTLAFLAERVEGVVSLEMETLEPVLLTLSRTTASVLCGQLTHPDGPIAVLDLDTLFSLRSQLPRVRRAG